MKIREEKIKKEYMKEYLRVCDNTKIDMIKNKPIRIIYDEVLPDLFVEVEVENKYIDSINYDIYADRIKSLMVKFPNGKEEIFNDIIIKDEYLDNELYSCSWQVPCVNIKYNSYNIELSVISLIENNVDVYIIDYDLTLKLEGENK